MEKLVKFETAKLAKEKGFDWKSLNNYNTEKELTGFSGYYLMVGYNKNSKVHLVDTNSEEFEYPDVLCIAPTQTSLQKWLREVHMIRVFPKQGASGNFNFEIYIWDKPNNIGKWTRIGNISSSGSYEEALEKRLYKALTLIELK